MTADRNLQKGALHDIGGASASRREKVDALVRLSGGVAHDFNNILHVIKNAAELLRHKLPGADADTTRLLDMLARNCGRGTRITRELLAFSGRQTLQPVALNVNRLVAEMQHRLREALGRGPQIETVLGGSLWQVHADPAELETAILKLAENARDAMAGGGKVTLETSNVVVDEARATPELAAGHYVAIAVSDTGVGMSHETRLRAFDPYFTTKEAGPMTGLGLSRVYGFVRQMRGQVAIASTPDAGTTVTLYFPRLERAAPGQAPAEDRREPNVVALGAKPGRPGGAKGLAGLRVLVVEDESLIGMLAEDFLEQLGCRMAGLVSSLNRALEMAKSAELDFALLDVDLGGEPVYPVAMALKARGVPFLFMSGYGGLEGPWRGRPIVQKPFDLEQLRREIERALAEKQ